MASDRQQFRCVHQLIGRLFLLSLADGYLLFDRTDGLLKGLLLRFRFLDSLQLLFRSGKASAQVVFFLIRQ